MKKEEFKEHWPEWQIIGNEPFGEGGFGKVFLVERSYTSVQTEISAMKVVEIPSNNNELESFRLVAGYNMQTTKQLIADTYEKAIKEIDSLAKLKGHPHIVHLEQYKSWQKYDEKEGITRHTICIRQEPLHPITEYYPNYRMSEAEVLKLGIQICDALEAVESVRITTGGQEERMYHRDVTPDNILIYKAPNGNISFRLADFGIARSISSFGTALSSPGKLDFYVAPEIINEGIATPTIDIYSLGMSLYFLLNGTRFPFITKEQVGNKKSYAEAVNCRIKNEKDIPVPENTSNAVARIVLKAIAFHPEDRYQSAAEMKKDLIECVRSGEFSSELKNEVLNESLISTPSFISVQYRKGAEYIIHDSARLLTHDPLFIARDRELQDLEAMLTTYHKVVVHGFGGIGKTSLVREYAIRIKDKYDYVILTHYDSSIKDMVAQENVLLEDHFRDRTSDGKYIESLDKYFNRKLKDFQRAARKYNLLWIIDNFDPKQNKLSAELNAMKKIIKAGEYDLIITSRDSFKDSIGLAGLEIGVLDDTSAYTLFESYYREPISPDEKETVNHIIRSVNSHTLVITLLAKQCRERHLDFAKLYQQLQESGLSSVKGNVFYDMSQYDSVFAVIKYLFNLTPLTNMQQELLRNAAFIPEVGIARDIFVQLSYTDIEADIGYANRIDDYYAASTFLINYGWVSASSAGILYIHPLIKELIHHELHPNLITCKNFFSNLGDMLGDFNVNPSRNKLLVDLWFSILANTDLCNTTTTELTKLKNAALEMIRNASETELLHLGFSQIKPVESIEQIIKLMKKLTHNLVNAREKSYSGNNEPSLNRFHRKCIFIIMQINQNTYKSLKEVQSAFIERLTDIGTKYQISSTVLQELTEKQQDIKQ